MSPPIAALRARLAEHLGRLGYNVDYLARQVREALATAVGRAGANAVTEALNTALASPSTRQTPSSRPSYLSRPSRPFWDEPDERAWRREYDDRDYNRGRWEGRDRPEEYDDQYPRDEDVDDIPPARTNVPARVKQPPWPFAAALGCQVSAWCLRRRVKQPAVALGFGLVAGLTALVRNPLILGGAGVLASALALVTLIEMAISASSAAADALTP